MKIAIPTRDNMVDNHFGHCEYYTIVSVSDDNKIESTETFKAPVGCGCKSNIATTLNEMGVDTMLAGNMGQGAVNKVSQAGIKIIRGCNGSVEEVTANFLNNKLNDSGLTCDHHHEDGHQCNH